MSASVAIGEQKGTKGDIEGAKGDIPAEILVTRVACPEEVTWNGWALPEESAAP